MPTRLTCYASGRLLTTFPPSKRTSSYGLRATGNSPDIGSHSCRTPLRTTRPGRRIRRRSRYDGRTGHARELTRHRQSPNQPPSFWFPWGTCSLRWRCAFGAVLSPHLTLVTRCVGAARRVSIRHPGTAGRVPGTTSRPHPVVVRSQYRDGVAPGNVDPESDTRPRSIRPRERHLDANPDSYVLHPPLQPTGRA